MAAGNDGGRVGSTVGAAAVGRIGGAVDSNDGALIGLDPSRGASPVVGAPGAIVGTAVSGWGCNLGGGPGWSGCFADVSFVVVTSVSLMATPSVSGVRILNLNGHA